MQSSTFSYSTDKMRLSAAVVTLLTFFIGTCVIVGCGSSLVDKTGQTAAPSGPSSGTGTAAVVQASQATVPVNSAAFFSVTQEGTPVTGGQWVVLGGSANGAIDANGLFHAPASIPTPATVSVDYIVAGQAYTGTVTVVGAATTTAVPAIKSILPNVVQKLSTSIQITGSGFIPSSLVTLDSTPIHTTYVDAQHLEAVITLQNPINASLQVSVWNPNNGGASGSATVRAVFPVISVQPTSLSVGNVSLTIHGSQFSPGDVVFMDGKPLSTVVNSSTQITASGFLKPWAVGSVVIEVASNSGITPVAAQFVPITPTTVTYDAAARYGTPTRCRAAHSAGWF
jgi:hypothetical protein